MVDVRVGCESSCPSLRAVGEHAGRQVFVLGKCSDFRECWILDPPMKQTKQKHPTGDR
jgi:hypothetical protein